MNAIIFLQIPDDFNALYPSLKFNIYNLWPRAAKSLIHYAEDSEKNFVLRKLNIEKPLSLWTEGISKDFYALKKYMHIV